jgi:hypothetical protein
MALNSKTSSESRNAALDAAYDLLDSGKFRIYDGTQPTDSNTALGAQVLLADLAFGADSFASASAGSKAANTITSDSSADATGTATWMTCTTSGNARRYDGSAGTGTVNLVLNTASIVAAAAVACSSWTFTLAA